jgi:hypothetical protein
MKIKLFYPPRNYPTRHPLVPYLALPLLFYLYSLLNKKKDVMSYFQKLAGIEFNFYKTRNVVQGEMDAI